MLSWIRSFLFHAGMVVSAIVWIPPALLLFPFPIRVRYRYLTQWSSFNIWWLRVTCNIRCEVQGRENIPEGPAIVLAKHQSAWETFALQQIFPPQTWVLKRELLWIPLFGWGLAYIGAVAIDRNAGKKALRQVIDEGTQRLKEGLWMIIFPEGTRVAPGVKGRYASGGAMLAEKSGYPVVPVAHNAGEFWPKKGLLKKPGVIKVRIGPVIESQGKKASEINRLTEEWIENEMEAISSKP